MRGASVCQLLIIQEEDSDEAREFVSWEGEHDIMERQRI